MLQSVHFSQVYPGWSSDISVKILTFFVVTTVSLVIMIFFDTPAIILLFTHHIACKKFSNLQNSNEYNGEREVMVNHQEGWPCSSF